jgi:hypothetical protein
MPKVQLSHIAALHQAAGVFEEWAERRKARMPTSSAALKEFAVTLRQLELILLAELPPGQAAAYHWVGKPDRKVP